MIGNIYHVCNRGVNKQNIFNGSFDYLRFLETLYKCNNKEGALLVKRTDFLDDPPPQNKIVEILKWSLLPNHYHLLLYEKVAGGIVEFVKRIGNSYTKYFNIRNERSGYLFQNKAKIIRVEKEAHFLYIPYYIELNPLDLMSQTWRRGEIKNIKSSLEFLSNYKWSSYVDYLNNRDFSKIINKDMFFDKFETNQKYYQKEMEALISGKKGSTWHVEPWSK